MNLGLTGAFTVPRAEEGRAYLASERIRVVVMLGEIVVAQAEEEDRALLERLERTRVLPTERCAELLRAAPGSEPLVQRLRAVVGEGILAHFLQERFRENLFRFLGGSASPEFTELDGVHDDPLQVGHDSRRLVDELCALHARLSGLDPDLELSPGEGRGGSPDEARILRLCTPSTSITVLVVRSPFERGRTLQLVHDMVSTQLLVARPPWGVRAVPGAVPLRVDTPGTPVRSDGSARPPHETLPADEDVAAADMIEDEPDDLLAAEALGSPTSVAEGAGGLRLVAFVGGASAPPPPVRPPESPAARVLDDSDVLTQRLGRLAARGAAPARAGLGARFDHAAAAITAVPLDAAPPPPRAASAPPRSAPTSPGSAPARSPAPRVREGSGALASGRWLGVGVLVVLGLAVGGWWWQHRGAPSSGAGPEVAAGPVAGATVDRAPEPVAPAAPVAPSVEAEPPAVASSEPAGTPEPDEVHQVAADAKPPAERAPSAKASHASASRRAPASTPVAEAAPPVAAPPDPPAASPPPPAPVPPRPRVEDLKNPFGAAQR